MIAWPWLLAAFGGGVLVGVMTACYCLLDLALKAADARDRS